MSILMILGFILPNASSAAKNDIEYGAELTFPPYTAQKIVFDFYFDHPQKIATALYWVKAILQTLGDEPYNFPPDDIHLVVIIHGTELVTLANKNYNKYKDIVERLRYYSELGVAIKICALAAQSYDYFPADFPKFVDMVPSAITELAHWQLNGHALVIPRVYEKQFSIEEIR